MAYGGCITPLGCTDCAKYDVFSNPNIIIDGSPVGTASKNNALSLNESRRNAIALQDSLEEGGLIFSVEPNHIPLGMSCFEVTIRGWYIGAGAAVTLAGVTSASINEQSKHHVTLNVDMSGATAGTGDLVITSAGFITTLTDGFTFDATASVEVVEDFETKLDLFFQSDDSNGWFYFDTNCPTGSGETCQYYGPASGDGMFALSHVDGSGRDAAFEAEFSSGNCVDTVTAIAVKYYAYSVPSHCFASDFLQLRVRFTAGGAWTTVASTSSIHSTNSEAWLSLASSLNSVVYGVQILAKTSSPLSSCDFWNPVAIDDITVSYSSVCDCATVAPTVTFAPSGVPSSSSPTPNVTATAEDDEDSGLLSGIPTIFLVAAGAGAVVFLCIMLTCCWCDNWRAGRRARKAEAQQRALVREQEMNTY